MQRVLRFIDRKSISGRQGLELTKEIEILLASSAVQLRLGLDTWDLSYFNNTIFIYPSEYRNPSTARMFCEADTEQFELLCKELRQNHVHVFIQNTFQD